jgi:hypothetical protein
MSKDPYFNSENNLLEPKEQLIVADLKLRQQELLKETQHFMRLQMVQINYKKNVCMLTRCYEDIFTSAQQRNICAKKCAFG